LALEIVDPVHAAARRGGVSPVLARHGAQRDGGPFKGLL
jgi:hypothetical protein